MPKDNDALNGHDNAFNFAGLTQAMPGMEALMQVQKRNAEVLTQAGQQIFQDIQALMQRQQEMIRENMQVCQNTMARMMQPAPPQEKMGAQAECAKEAMEKAAAQTKELFDMAAACQMRAAEMMTTRMGEAFEEFRSAYTRK